MFINNVELRQLNRRFGDEVFPLDVEWKNCLQGPDAYLNCPKRIEKKEAQYEDRRRNHDF
jgi:hypothetical protein